MQQKKRKNSLLAKKKSFIGLLPDLSLQFFFLRKQNGRNLTKLQSGNSQNFLGIFVRFFVALWYCLGVFIHRKLVLNDLNSS